MTTIDKPGLSMADWSLEPLTGESSPAAPAGPVKFHANTRSKTDRRTLPDRRQAIRFEPDRRVADRRPKTSWEPGSNL